MRIAVTATRTWANREYLYGVLDGIHASQTLTVVVHDADDELTPEWARLNHVKTLPFKAHWDEVGRGAGARRNEAMLTYGRPELVIAFLENGSLGSAAAGALDLVGRARAIDLECWVFSGPKAPGAARSLETTKSA